MEAAWEDPGEAIPCPASPCHPSPCGLTGYRAWVNAGLHARPCRRGPPARPESTAYEWSRGVAAGEAHLRFVRGRNRLRQLYGQARPLDCFLAFPGRKANLNLLRVPL